MVLVSEDPDWVDELAHYVSGLRMGRQLSMGPKEARSLTTNDTFERFVSVLGVVSAGRTAGKNRITTAVSVQATGPLTARLISTHMLKDNPDEDDPALGLMVGRPDALPASMKIIDERPTACSNIDFYCWRGGKLRTTGLAPMLIVVQRRHGREARNNAAAAIKIGRSTLESDLAIVRTWLQERWEQLVPASGPKRQTIEVLLNEELTLTPEHLWAIAALLDLEGVDAPLITRWALGGEPVELPAQAS
jgi:hypothetical protein